MKLSQKALVILAVAFIMAVVSNVNAAECNLTVSKKKESAKTAYLGNVKLSGKILNALSVECKLNVKVLSKKEFLNMQLRALQTKISKL